MEHSFDVAIAKEYGVHSAILLKNLYFWIQKNATNGRHYHDGTYWTYNSRKAFSKLFPYLTARQVQYAIDKLIEDGLVRTGNFSKDAFDQTIWYAITEKGYSILQNCQMVDLTKNAPPSDNFVKSTLSDSKHTDSKPDGEEGKPHAQKKSKKKEVVRHQYGEYKNVLLSDEEIEKLKKEFPDKYLSYIERVSGYMKQHNKSYSDYLATIRNWIRRDMEKEQAAQKPAIYDPDSEGLKY